MVSSKASFEARVATDWWAYGRLLATLANMGGMDMGGKILHDLAISLTDAAPESPGSLDNAIRQLEDTSR